MGALAGAYMQALGSTDGLHEMAMAAALHPMSQCNEMQVLLPSRTVIPLAQRMGMSSTGSRVAQPKQSCPGENCLVHPRTPQGVRGKSYSAAACACCRLQAGGDTALRDTGSHSSMCACAALMRGTACMSMPFARPVTSVYCSALRTPSAPPICSQIDSAACQHCQMPTLALFVGCMQSTAFLQGGLMHIRMPITA